MLTRSTTLKRRKLENILVKCNKKNNNAKTFISLHTLVCAQCVFAQSEEVTLNIYSMNSWRQTTTCFCHRLQITECLWGVKYYLTEQWVITAITYLSILLCLKKLSWFASNIRICYTQMMHWSTLHNQYSLTHTWCRVCRWRAVTALITAAAWHNIFVCQLSQIGLHFKTSCQQNGETVKIRRKSDIWGKVAEIVKVFLYLISSTLFANTLSVHMTCVYNSCIIITTKPSASVWRYLTWFGPKVKVETS